MSTAAESAILRSLAGSRPRSAKASRTAATSADPAPRPASTRSARTGRLRERAFTAVAEYHRRSVNCFQWWQDDLWCGLDDPALLELDHKADDGAATNRAGGTRRCYDAIREPWRFQLLCAHHHIKKGKC